MTNGSEGFLAAVAMILILMVGTMHLLALREMKARTHMAVQAVILVLIAGLTILAIALPRVSEAALFGGIVQLLISASLIVSALRFPVRGFLDTRKGEETHEGSGPT